MPQRIMNSRLIMTSAAIFLGLAGVACLFLPDEVLKLYSIDSSTSSVQTQSQTAGAQILIQILGGCFLALASLDWFSKRAMLGGIYGRPVVGTNYAHFVIGSLVMAKVLIGADEGVCRPQVWITLVVYVLFAIAFSFMMFGKPKLPQRD